MTDSELIEDLRTALDEASAGVRMVSDAALIAQRRGRRRRATRGLLIGLPAVALVIGVAVGLHGGSPASDQQDASIGYVTSHTEAALSKVDGYIIKTVRHNPGMTITTWTDPVTMATHQVSTTASGTVTLREAWSVRAVVSGVPMWHTTYIEPLQHLWWTTDVPVRGPTDQAPPLVGGAVEAPLIDPLQMEAALKNGRVTVVGKVRLGGKDAIRVLVGGTSGYVAELWLDGQTYQPLHMSYPPGSASGIEVTWVPKTAELATATETPRIPPDAKQVSGVPPSVPLE